MIRLKSEIHKTKKMSKKIRKDEEEEDEGKVFNAQKLVGLESLS